MTFYAEMATDALELLEEFGGDIALTRESDGSINPITGVVTSGTDASVTTTGLLVSFADKMIDGTRILDGDRKLVISSEHEPLPSDKPVIGGEEWSIVKINPIKSVDVAVVYFVQVRK